MTGPENGVVITLADIYKQLVGLTTRVESALAKVDRVDQALVEVEALVRPLTGMDRQVSDHEARLRALERSRWPIASVSVLAALGSLIVAVLVALYGRK